MRWKLLIIFVLAGVLLTACTSKYSEPLSTLTLPVSEDLVRQTPDMAKEQENSAQSPSPQPTNDLRAMGMVTILPRDFIQSIDNPTYLTADEADSEYAPYELVIGIEINGDARAYSTPFLSKHEIVNDAVGGVPLAVTWCPLCFTALVYERTVDGKVLTFGVSGRLMHNGLVMFDRETDSFWPQMLGEAVHGPMLGAELKFVPAFQTTWEDWKTTHPDTLALEKGYFGGDDPYLEYYEFDTPGIVRPNRIDNRMNLKEFVIGVEHLGDTVAFPFSVMSLEPIVNYHVGNTPILAVFNAETATGLAYERSLQDGRILTFKVKEGMILVDLETESTWDGVTGEAFSGPLAGEALSRVKSTLSFWFGWFDYHPDTDVYGIPED